MPRYRYEAAGPGGARVKEVAEAADETELKTMLASKGLYPLSIEEAAAPRKLMAGRVGRKDLLTFTQELGSLLEAGLPIDRAISVLSVHSEKEAMRRLLVEVFADLQRGQSLSQSLSRHPVFPPVYINMIRAGELGGILETVIKRLAEFIETSVKFQEELATALVYPVLLTVVGGMAVTFIVMFVVPRFAVMFEDMGQAMPLPTLMLLNASTFLAMWWWALLLGAAGLVAGGRAYLRTEEGTLMLDSLRLKIPLVRALHTRALTARFARTMGTLIASGVPILEAISVSRQVVGNSVVSKKLEALENGVRKGRGVAAPMRECGVFPSLVEQMVAVGEEAGRLEQSFMTVADRFEAESRSLIKRIMGLVAPLLILMMAVVIGFIVVSMLLAVFSVNDIPF